MRVLWKIMIGLVVVLTCFSLVVCIYVKTACWSNVSRMLRTDHHQVPKVPLIVSMTTIPSRLASEEFKSTVFSILNQSPAPQELRLNIPYVMKRKNQKYEIPAWLASLPVNIVRCEDYGPATKYLPTVLDLVKEDRWDQYVVVMDDDAIWPPGAMQSIMQCIKAHPGCAMTGYGRRLQRDESGNVIPHMRRGKLVVANSNLMTYLMSYEGYDERVVQPNHDEPVDIMYGVMGIAFTPRMVSVSDLQDYQKLPPEAFFVDDVVLSACLAMKNTPTMVVPNWPDARIISWMGGFDGLFDGPNAGTHNNDTMIQYYADVWKP